MNERIKELAEQVDKEFNSPYDRHKAIEKFAELIVKECIEVLRLVTYEVDIDFGTEEVFQEAIKKHFGVEE
jgi:NTP pyrophosphatase (non-canonical NTP hydrolase)